MGKAQTALWGLSLVARDTEPGQKEVGLLRLGGGGVELELEWLRWGGGDVEVEVEVGSLR